MNNNKLYPLTFVPILKEIIWGGHRLEPFKGLPSSEKKIGESWEISLIPGSISVVAEGSLKGRLLSDLISEYGSELLGRQVYEKYGDTFPLLIKYIDAAADLSIQVHPNDEIAQQRHHSFGKTEMWYVVDAAPDATLKTGFREKISETEFVARSEDGTIADALASYRVNKGDLFFLPAGRIHAICSGCLVAEIQQNSNITYRIYDYKRKDADGNERELHTELAKDVIDYSVSSDYRTQYDMSPALSEHRQVVESPYFITSIVQLRGEEIHISLAERDSFTVCMVVEGDVELEADGQKCSYKMGRTILVPASCHALTLRSKAGARVMECFVPGVARGLTEPSC
ncbi:mannose-6-phosphate isomerase [Porphyromonas sp. COT-108 OH2963]|uniref:type I phosphomannose isomerase catalytic subunit n=1 Tax=Porphyromonas sp. COT-108 OH2963 TaxID=1515614 RepID=UPI00052D2625|nr:type I phosphomannose isomerase catalytic subunit [Porphyromonas sp. COT-108 OH2963]KGN94771.1 mannose-6-phosphate isomerase [Porphyromonas sp. COT-108 OH2963]